MENPGQSGRVQGVQRVQGSPNFIPCKPAGVRECRHTARERVTDPETKQVSCHKCGLELPSPGIKVTSEKYGRGTVNELVYRKNLGSTTKQNGEPGPEPLHYEAVSAVYGNRNGSKIPLERITKTCPGCGKQQPIRVFGESIRCENQDCGIELGHFVLRWLPYIPQNGQKNGSGNNAMRYMADLRVLQLWDPPEDDPTLKLARQLFSKKVLGHLSPEDAHFLAKRFLRGVKQLSMVHRKDVEDLLEGLLEGEGIIIR